MRSVIDVESCILIVKSAYRFMEEVERKGSEKLKKAALDPT